MKKYIANTAISVSVSLPGTGRECARVSFSALTDGSSVYYTDDEEIQWALEHHYKFGKLFRLEQTEEQYATTAKKPPKSPAKKGKKASKKETSEMTIEEIAKEWEEFSPEDESNPANEESDDDEEQEGETEPREVTVTDMDAAKDYLAENFDVVRTKLKTEDIIKETALSFGIEFKFL